MAEKPRRGLDLAEQLEDEIEQFGGMSLVVQLTTAAAREAQGQMFWYGDGDEPYGRHSIYCAALWQLFQDERLARAS